MRVIIWADDLDGAAILDGISYLGIADAHILHKLTELELMLVLDLDDDTRARLGQGERIVAVLKQNHNAPVTVEHQVCILYAVVHDYLKEVPVELISEYETSLYERLDAQHMDLLNAIRETGELSKDSEAKLKDAIQAFTADFMKLHSDKE